MFAPHLRESAVHCPWSITEHNAEENCRAEKKPRRYVTADPNYPRRKTEQKNRNVVIDERE